MGRMKTLTYKIEGVLKKKVIRYLKVFYGRDAKKKNCYRAIRTQLLIESKKVGVGF